MDAVEQAEGGGLPEARVRPAFDEASRCVPLAECGGVSQGCSTGDDRAVRVDLGTGVEERVEDLDIITTRGPVQRGLTVGADETGVDVGARPDERGHRGGAVREMTGPVGRHVQQRAGLAVVPDAGDRKAGVISKESVECIEVTGPDCVSDRRHEWVSHRQRCGLFPVRSAHAEHLPGDRAQRSS